MGMRSIAPPPLPEAIASVERIGGRGVDSSRT